MELPLCYCRHHVAVEGEVRDIASGQHDTLLAGKPEQPAYSEEPLDLLVEPANCLDIAELIERSGYGKILPDGDF